MRTSNITNYCNCNIYPYIVSPDHDSKVSLPDNSRSDIFSYSTKAFFEHLKDSDFPISSSIGFSLPTIGRSTPYEPEITLYDSNLNLYLAVEIDEPYHQYYRFPLNYRTKDVETGEISYSNQNKDIFFKNNGWYVIHFSEEQIITKPDECIKLLRNIVLELIQKEFEPVIFNPENRWDITEAIAWEKEFRRESYLHIQQFNRPFFIEDAENTVVSTEHNSDTEAPNVIFNEEKHIYTDERDTSGAANYISVTTLIEKFFPYFDEEAYIQKFIAQGKTREEVIEKKNEPSRLGTKMHEQIEFFLKGKEHDEDFKEFDLFKNFYKEQIERRGLKFFDAEKQIIYPQFNIAGTVDALFQKPNGDFVMVDWKRSKNLIVNGYPKKYGFGKGLSILSHLENSSYYHYELQQSFYKYILEHEYGMHISSMILCVLHQDYDRYYTIKLSDYREKEVVSMIAAHYLCNR